ncbi:MAG: hypothetical protein KAQ98_12800 [Bacteriovoracaceae bacterium]|nr:hypothetical protein [Bacteriovoracaceae bacterium]
MKKLLIGLILLSSVAAFAGNGFDLACYEGMGIGGESESGRCVLSQAGGRNGEGVRKLLQACADDGDLIDGLIPLKGGHGLNSVYVAIICK